MAGFSTNPFGAYYDKNGALVNPAATEVVSPVTETVETKPVVAAPVAVVGKPTAPSAFKYDKLNPEGLSYDDAYAQWQAQKEQYDADLANWQSTSTDPEAIDWRTNDYRNKYSYLTDANGKPLDGYIFSGLADGSMTPDSFATYKTDWAKKQLANKDWSGYDEALKNKYIQDVADGKIKPPPPPAPTPEPEPEPITPVEEQSYNPKTGLLNSVNVGATNADGSLNVTSDKLTDEQKQAMIDGTPTTLGVDKNGKPVIGTWIKNADGTASFVANGLRLRTISKDEFDKSKITAQTAGKVTTQVADKADVERVKAGLIGEHWDAEKGQWVKVIKDPTTLIKTDADGNIVGGALSKLSDYKKDVPQYKVGDKITPAIDALNEKTSAVKVDVNPESLVSNRMAGLLSQNNPYIQTARNDAILQASRRGMLNNAASAGYAQDAAIRAAYQIAKDESQAYADAQKANALAENTLVNKKYDTSATALGEDTKRSQVVSDANVKSEIDYNAEDKKNLVAGLGTQFAAEKTQEAQQYQGDNGNFQFNTSAQNTANNAYTASQNAAYQSTADNTVKTELFNVDQVNGIAKVNVNNYLAWMDKKYDTLNDAEKLKYNSINEAVKTNAVLRSEVQKSINSQVFTEINSKNAESNTLQRLLTSGNIELAQTAAKNYFDKAMASDKFERDTMLAKLQHSYDLEKIQITNDFDWNKFQIEVLAKKEIAQADREAQVITSFASDVMREVGALDRMPDIEGTAKTEKENQYLAMAAGFINYLSDGGSLGVAELLMPDFSKSADTTDTKKATDNKGMLAVNWND